MNYKDQLESFKSSCRMYPQEKQDIEEYRNSSLEQDPVKQKYFLYMQDDITYVESSFKEIREKCGTNAVLLIWMLFVERKTQTALAEEWHMDRMHIRYAMDRWMHILLEQKEVTYKDILFSFKSSCMMYSEEEKRMEELKGTIDTDSVHKNTYKLIQNDLDYTDQIFHAIEEHYGSDAKKLAYEVLVQGKTQTHVASENNMTKRQLEYAMGGWLKTVLTEYQGER